MTREEFLDVLARLRCAPVGRARLRAPHKPLLLLWLFGRRFTSKCSTTAGYSEAEEPVSTLINDFGPPVASASAGRQRAAMPFVHLEREIWDLRDGSGAVIGPDAPERGPWLAGRGAVGRLRPGVEQLLADPGTLAAAARLLLDLHFTPGLAAMICDAVGLDLAVLELAASPAVAAARRSLRRPGFPEEVLRAYAYQCAMCGFDGALGRNPVGLEAAHVRWHSQDGPDVLANGLALCALHHALFDLGVLGLTTELHIRVSSLYMARSDAGRRAVDDLSGQHYREPVWHCAVRAAPEDRLLSDAEWAQVATAIMDRTGLAPVGDDLAVRWVAVRHAPDHIHLVATWPGKTRSAPRSGTTTSGSGRAARTQNASSACVAPLQPTAPLPGGRPGPSRSRRSGVAGMSRPAPGSAAKSALPPPERAQSKSSSPAWPRLECWSAAGTARSARVR